MSYTMPRTWNSLILLQLETAILNWDWFLCVVMLSLSTVSSWWEKAWDEFWVSNTWGGGIGPAALCFLDFTVVQLTAFAQLEQKVKHKRPFNFQSDEASKQGG